MCVFERSHGSAQTHMCCHTHSPVLLFPLGPRTLHSQEASRWCACTSKSQRARAWETEIGSFQLERGDLVPMNQKHVLLLAPTAPLVIATIPSPENWLAHWADQAAYRDGWGGREPGATHFTNFTSLSGFHQTELELMAWRLGAFRGGTQSPVPHARIIRSAASGPAWRQESPAAQTRTP